jgi:hypothetical protein
VHSNSAPTRRAVQRPAAPSRTPRSTPLHAGPARRVTVLSVTDGHHFPVDQSLFFNFATDIRAFNSTSIKPTNRRPARAVVVRRESVGGVEARSTTEPSNMVPQVAGRSAWL